MPVIHVAYYSQLKAANTVMDNGEDLSNSVEGAIVLIMAAGIRNPRPRDMFLKEWAFGSVAVDFQPMWIPWTGQYTEVTKSLLADGVDPHRVPVFEEGVYDEIPVLCGPAFFDCVDAIEVLIEAGANVGARTGKGMTALFYTTVGGHVNATRALVAAGSTVTVQDDDRRTALFMAAHFHKVKAIKLPNECGTDVLAWDDDEGTALFVVVARDAYAAFDVLVKLGADTDEKTADGLNTACFVDGLGWTGRCAVTDGFKVKSKGVWALRTWAKVKELARMTKGETATYDLGVTGSGGIDTFNDVIDRMKRQRFNKVRLKERARAAEARKQDRSKGTKSPISPIYADFYTFIRFDSISILNFQSSTRFDL
jgi:hypothetical protein